MHAIAVINLALLPQPSLDGIHTRTSHGPHNNHAAKHLPGLLVFFARGACQSDRQQEDLAPRKAKGLVSAKTCRKNPKRPTFCVGCIRELSRQNRDSRRVCEAPTTHEDHAGQIEYRCMLQEAVTD